MVLSVFTHKVISMLSISIKGRTLYVRVAPVLEGAIAQFATRPSPNPSSTNYWEPRPQLPVCLPASVGLRCKDWLRTRDGLTSWPAQA